MNCKWEREHTGKKRLEFTLYLQLVISYEPPILLLEERKGEDDKQNWSGERGVWPYTLPRKWFDDVVWCKHCPL